MKKVIYILLFILVQNCSVTAQQRLAPDQSIASSKYLRYYPNPAAVFINFDFQKSYNSHLSLMVFNLMGKKVYEIKNLTSRNFITLDDFYRGIYIYQLRDKNGVLLESGKFQVIK